MIGRPLQGRPGELGGCRLPRVENPWLFKVSPFGALAGHHLEAIGQLSAGSYGCRPKDKIRDMLSHSLRRVMPPVLVAMRERGGTRYRRRRLQQDRHPAGHLVLFRQHPSFPQDLSYRAGNRASSYGLYEQRFDSCLSYRLFGNCFTESRTQNERQVRTKALQFFG